MSDRSVAAGSLPLPIASLLRDISFEDVVRGGWYGYPDSDALADSAKTVFDRFTQVFSDTTIGDESLRAFELATLSKVLCNWRAKGRFPFAYEGNDLRFRNAAQLALLKVELSSVCREMLSFIAGYVRSTPASTFLSDTRYPVDKGKGAPFWNRGRDRQAAYALAAVCERSASVRELTASLHELGATKPLWLTLGTRIQASAKRRPTGSFGPKVRKIIMVPFVLNYPLAEVGSVMLKAMRAYRTPWLPEIELVMAATRDVRANTLVGEDISNYDDTVGVETWDFVVDALVRPALDLLYRAGYIGKRKWSLSNDVLTYIRSAPILLPPRSASEDGYVLEREGGIISGIRLTSALGTLINAARVRARAKSVSAGLRSYFCFGDDTLIVGRRATDAEAYANATPDGQRGPDGFITERAVDPSFLMKRVPAGYGYVSRMLISTMQKEAHFEPTNTVIAALGISARADAIRGNPFERHYHSAVRDGLLGTRLSAAYSLAHMAGFQPGRLAELALGSQALEDDAKRGAVVDDLLLAYGYDVTEGERRLAQLGLPDTVMEAYIASRPSLSQIQARANEFRLPGRNGNKKESGRGKPSVARGGLDAGRILRG